MTLSELKKLNKKNGQHFFDKDTMRFFDSKVALFDVCSEFFVTSEKNGDQKRRFTLRRYNPKTGSVFTVGEFQGFATKARAWLARLEAK